MTPPSATTPDLVVRADLAFLYRVWLGQIKNRYDAAIPCGRCGEAIPRSMQTAQGVHVEPMRVLLANASIRADSGAIGSGERRLV